MAKAKPPAPPAESIPDPKILRAFRPGDTVFLECERMMPDVQMERMHAWFTAKVPNLRIIILQAGVKVAGAALVDGESEPPTSALSDVVAERARQQQIEGWTPEHDDAHDTGDLAVAAVCYIAHNSVNLPKSIVHNYWPWEPEWWKPKGARRDLVRAGALILAEIERLDRAASTKESGQ